MKKLLFLLFCNVFGASAQFTDSFSDGNFTVNPAWSGDASKFIINTDTMLQSNGSSSSADTLHLVTPSTIIDSAEWQFFMKLLFNPTESTNYVKVYLVSDQSNLKSALNGYFIRIGETGASDTLELYQQTGTTETKIFTGKTAFGTTTTARIKVIRDNAGNWNLYVDAAGGNNFSLEGTVTDNTHITTGFFGVYCKYSTTSRYNQYLFDDFYAGSIIADTMPPAILSVTVLSDTTLDVIFSEKVNTTAEVTTNFTVDNGIGNPYSALINTGDSSIVRLTFAAAFTNGTTYSLTVDNVQDRSGNTIKIPEVRNFFYFVAVPASFKDVVFNEFMPVLTPDPPSLPDREFVELFNSSSKTFDLNGWKFINTTTVSTLPSFIFKPNSYLTLCSDADTSLFSPYGAVIGISSWTSLSDSGDSLTLSDNSSNMIDVLSYSSGWLGFTSGGISMELINPGIPCGFSANWAASTDAKGGTPGAINSVYSAAPDITAPLIKTGFIISDSMVEIIFNESMDSSSLVTGSYSISGGFSVTNITAGSGDNSSVQLLVSPAFMTGTIYTIVINGVKDCSGNTIATQSAKNFAVPEQAVQGDIIINEVLFNPRTGGSDFVEIYNNSVRYIDLKNWGLANWSSTGISNKTTITSSPYILAPGEYTLLSANLSNIILEYPLGNVNTFLSMASMPSYNDDSGTVYLINNTGDLSDNFSYNKSMHFALLDDKNGVSLERISFNRPTGDKGNWHSAAEVVGFATPGYQNSQFMITGEITSPVTIDPEIFSPDNDGNEDVVNIIYKFNTPGFVANVTIYDSKGRLVKNLVKNELLGNTGTFTWDGITDENNKARIGIYVILFEAFNLEGTVEKHKKTCVLASRL